MTGGQAAARGLSVGVFLVAALIAFFAAIVDNAGEAYITWGSPTVVGLLAFGGANVAARCWNVVAHTRRAADE